MSLWEFLRDEQNREALKIVGGALAALVIAGWAFYLDRRRTQRQISALAGEIEQIKNAQADMLRSVERSEQRHDLLFGVMVGKTVITAETKVGDEPPEDAP